MIQFPNLPRPTSINIHPFSPEAIRGFGAATAGTGASYASAVWPSGSLAIFYPFFCTDPVTIKTMYLANGAAVSGNVDLGIYTAAGTRLVSSGSTAQAGTNAPQLVDITDTVLPVFTELFMALAIDNTTGTTLRIAPGTVGSGRSIGLYQMAAAFPLPATATFAAYGQTYIPVFGASQMTVY